MITTLRQASSWPSIRKIHSFLVVTVFLRLLVSEVGSAIFLGGALSLECYLFLQSPLALDRNDFEFASAISAIPL